MSYGYVGDTSTSIKQQVKNAGVLSVSDVLDLEGKGQLGGSLELIEEQTVSGTPSSLDFNSILENKYSAHLFVFNIQNTASASSYLKLSSDNGSTYVSSIAFKIFSIDSTGSNVEDAQTSNSFVRLTKYGGNTQRENGYIYLYNLGNSNKYSSVTYQGVAHNGTNASTHFGGGVYSSTTVINGIRIYPAGTTYSEGFAKLYGIKNI
jgi:hypothetical protein